jgi:hypothetical protein
MNKSSLARDPRRLCIQACNHRPRYFSARPDSEPRKLSGVEDINGSCLASKLPEAAPSSPSFSVSGKPARYGDHAAFRDLVRGCDEERPTRFRCLRRVDKGHSIVSTKPNRPIRTKRTFTDLRGLRNTHYSCNLDIVRLDKGNGPKLAWHDVMQTLG